MTVRELYDLLAPHVVATPDMPVILEVTEWTTGLGGVEVLPMESATTPPVVCVVLTQRDVAYGDDWWRIDEP